MDDRTAIKIKRKLERVARSYGQLAEDLVQDAFVNILEGKETMYSSRPDWSIINAYRRSFGCKQVVTRAQLQNFNNPKPIEDLKSVEGPVKVNETSLDFDRLTEKLTPFHRGIMSLMFKWDFNIQEIADAFGIEHYQATRLVEKAMDAIKQREMEINKPIKRRVKKPYRRTGR